VKRAGCKIVTAAILSSSRDAAAERNNNKVNNKACLNAGIPEHQVRIKDQIMNTRS